jgi:allantoinase
MHASSWWDLGSCMQAVEEGLPITVETCAHYLTFADEDVPSGATQFKCAPPLRDAQNREALREATGGAIAMVSSDHSPAPNSTKSFKSGSFLNAWGGIAGLQYTLPAVNTLAQVRCDNTGIAFASLTTTQRSFA